MNIEALDKKLDEVYADHETNLTRIASLQVTVDEAGDKLNTARAAVLDKYPDPKDRGANKDERDAFMDKHTAGELEEFRLAIRELDRAKNKLAVSEHRVAHVRAKLRLAEVMAGIAQKGTALSR